MTGERTDADSFWLRYGWLLAAVWVVFLAFPVVSIAESGLAAPAQVTGYLLVAAFAAVYLGAFHAFSSELGVSATGHRRARVPFALLLLIAAASVPILGRDAVSFGPFIISYAAYLLSTRTMWIANVVVLTITVAVVVPGNKISNYIFLLGLIGAMIVVNAVNTALIRHSISADQLRMDYALLEAQDRMARDVHDVLGHSLTAVGLKAELAERLLDSDPEAARAELVHIRLLTAEALESIRATVGGLRSTTLAEELATMRAALDDAHIKTVLVGNPQTLDPMRSTALSWILREAVTNVLRHAHATTCWIRLTDSSLSIDDDGDSLGASRPGHGIRGMRERARLAGADCGVGPSEFGGTRVAVHWA